MLDQVSMFEEIEKSDRQRKDDERFEEQTVKYKKWLTLPDETLIKEGTPEREGLAYILGDGYCELYYSAYHLCNEMPKEKYIWLNHCEDNYWVLHHEDNISSKHVEECPYCGAKLGEGKGDAILYKAPAKYWLFYLHWDMPMRKLGYQPKEDREAIRKVWG